MRRLLVGQDELSVCEWRVNELLNVVKSIYFKNEVTNAWEVGWNTLGLSVQFQPAVLCVVRPAEGHEENVQAEATERDKRICVELSKCVCSQIRPEATENMFVFLREGNCASDQAPVGVSFSGPHAAGLVPLGGCIKYTKLLLNSPRGKQWTWQEESFR